MTLLTSHGSPQGPAAARQLRLAVPHQAGPVQGRSPDEQRLVLVWQQRLVRRLFLFDALAGGAAALLALAVAVVPAAGRQGHELLALAFPALWVLVCASTRSYEYRFLGAGGDEFRRVLDAGLRLLAAAAVVTLGFDWQAGRPYVLVALPTAVLFSLCLRGVARWLLYRQRAAGRSLHRVVVVGRERSCAELVRQLRRDPRAGFSVVGACVNVHRSDDVEGVPVVGTSDTVVDAVRQTGADTVAVGAWSDFDQQDLARLSWELEGTGIDLVVAPSLTDVTGPRIHIRPVAGMPLLHVDEPEFTGGRRLLKGSLDRAVALAALLVLVPLLLVVALVVRLDSSGPALFKQRRTGAYGRDFSMYKFRSMYIDAEARLNDLQALNEAADGLLFKVRDDPRVTRVGRFLRRYSIDELPQLINIVRGDMSLVGPRPPLPAEVSQYGEDVRRRLLVKPGLTGLWQVSGRSDLSWVESVRLDLHYVANWSLALDVVILWKTASAVLQRRGAY